jgi:7-cyano-7-deazaguanine synthase
MSGKPIVLYSGGLDSTVLLWSLRPNVKALLFDYGQRHRKELLHAINICEADNIEYEIANLVPIRNLLASGSQTGNEPVPEGHYAEESMKATVVPNRNMIMLSIAVGWAVSTGSQKVLWAAHAGDHAIYPDCRPEFLGAMVDAIQIGNAWSPVLLEAPFIYKTKAEIVKLGAELHAPLDQTFSCYKGGILHCGMCGTCTERKEAFQLAGVVDPTEYEK